VKLSGSAAAATVQKQLVAGQNYPAGEPVCNCEVHQNKQSVNQSVGRSSSRPAIKIVVSGNSTDSIVSLPPTPNNFMDFIGAEMFRVQFPAASSSRIMSGSSFH